MTDDVDVDVAIIGAGPVGMALALALVDSPHRVLLIDSRPRSAWQGDPRALAISQGSRQLLEQLGAWNADAATAIREIHVSQRGGFGRTEINAKDYGIPALGYVMRYPDLAKTLDSQISDEKFLDQCRVDRIEADGDSATLSVTHKSTSRRIKTKLIVHAEGSPNNGPDIKVHDYGQLAIVAEVRPIPGHNHRAWERFTPDGPLALLPLGEDYSIVFTVTPDKAADLLNLDDAGFLSALREQFGRRLDFVSTGPRTSFPLALRVRPQITQQRQVWIGNNAQTLHPVSGQGFNLGLRDAWELADELCKHNDAGNPAALAAYAHGRQLDRHGSIAFTDSIVRLFSNDIPPLRFARGLGLLALDLFPPLRHFVAKRMIWGSRAWP